MRVVTFVCSTFGSFGSQALDFIRQMERYVNLFVPASPSFEVSWATLTVISFTRMAVTLQVRKRIAALI